MELSSEQHTTRLSRTCPLGYLDLDIVALSRRAMRHLHRYLRIFSHVCELYNIVCLNGFILIKYHT
jgi:hypothetical protein